MKYPPQSSATRNKVRSARRRVLDPFERNLIFVQQLLGLSNAEKELLLKPVLDFFCCQEERKELDNGYE